MIMCRQILFLFTAFFLVSCSTETDETKADSNEVQEATRSTVLESKDRGVSPSNCLLLKDSVLVDEAMEQIALALDRKDDEEVLSKLSPRLLTSSKSDLAEGTDALNLVKEYLLGHQIAPSLKSEMIVTKRMLPLETTDCFRYQLLRDFTQSEYSVVFYFEKKGEQILIVEVEIIG